MDPIKITTAYKQETVSDFSFFCIILSMKIFAALLFFGGEMKMMHGEEVAKGVDGIGKVYKG
jgi:hypothetical protein